MKNVNVGTSVAAKLSSSHIPKEFFCNTHFCLKMDERCPKVLARCEQRINLKCVMISKLDHLKHFLNGGCVAEKALETISNLVSPSGKKISVCDSFDLVLADAGRTRKFHSFKQRRFGTLGYSSAATLPATFLFNPSTLI